MDKSNSAFEQRDEILNLVMSGHAPRTLASKFGVTEWTIKRWVAHVQRRKQLPYWRQMSAAPAPNERH
jgi:transposase